MNYNRYLDLHLCTSSQISELKKRKNSDTFFTYNGNEYFYEFTNDILKQARYREAKTEGFTFGDKGNSKIIDDEEVTRSSAGFLRVLGSQTWPVMTAGTDVQLTEQLKQLRYISCKVEIERLKATDTNVYGNLAALVHWICDPHTVNKLRVNCHGEGTATSGFKMGKVVLTAEEFVSALVRHGLTRPATHSAPALGLAHAARWKLDSEKAVCEDCKRPFSMIRRRHHCRRCGGLFCDACSAKTVDLAVALTGENNATAKNVKRARVCNACYAAVAGLANAFRQDKVLREVFGEHVGSQETGETKYGLQQINLALCMGARTDKEFSPDGGAFLRDSLAGRVIAELRRHNLHGIRLSASNQVVASTDKGIVNQCGVTYPTDDHQRDSEIVDNSIRNLGVGQPTVEIPAYIWGTRAALKTSFTKYSPPASPAVPLPSAPPARANARKSLSLPTAKQNAKRKTRFTDGITVFGRSLHFSSGELPEDMDVAAAEFLNHWEFTSWTMYKVFLPGQPGAGPGAAGGIASVLNGTWTWRITAPSRVSQIDFVAAPNKNRIRITGREEELLKRYKLYEVS